MGLIDSQSKSGFCWSIYLPCTGGLYFIGNLSPGAIRGAIPISESPLIPRPGLCRGRFCLASRTSRSTSDTWDRTRLAKASTSPVASCRRSRGAASVRCHHRSYGRTLLRKGAGLGCMGPYLPEPGPSARVGPVQHSRRDKAGSDIPGSGHRCDGATLIAARLRASPTRCQTETSGRDRLRTSRIGVSWCLERASA